MSIPSVAALSVPEPALPMPRTPELSYPPIRSRLHWSDQQRQQSEADQTHTDIAADVCIELQPEHLSLDPPCEWV